MFLEMLKLFCTN